MKTYFWVAGAVGGASICSLSDGGAGRATVEFALYRRCAGFHLSDEDAEEEKAAADLFVRALNERQAQREDDVP